MSFHTPGPWDLSDRGDYSDFGGNSRVILSAEPHRICVVHTDGSAENEANARLIAAAPDLLEAAIELERILPGNGPTAHSAVQKLRAAIAKVEGRV